MPDGARDVIYLVTKSAAEVVKPLPVLGEMIGADGMIRVSRPGKAFKVATEDTVRVGLWRM